MKKSEIGCLPCPAARTVDIVGDGWTLLILRDAVLFGSKRFDDFQQALEIPTNILSDRLAKLVAHGILERHEARRGRSSHEYLLTPKGEELWPVVAGILGWGNRWMTDDGLRAVHMVHRSCGTNLVAAPGKCPGCGAPVHAADLSAEVPIASPTPTRPEPPTRPAPPPI